MKFSLTIVDPVELCGSMKEGKVNPAYTIDVDQKDNVSEGGSAEDLLNSESEMNKPKWYTRFLGIFCAILCSIVFSLATIVLKKIQSYHALNLTLFRFQGVLVPSLCVLIYYLLVGKKDAFASITPGKSNVYFRRNIIMLFLRGIIAFGAILCQTYSLQHLDVGDSTVIVMSSPIVVAFLAHFLLKEDLGIIPVVVCITSLCGVIIIARPPFITGESYDFNALVGVGMSLSSMIFSSMIFVVLRFLKEIPTCLITSVFGVLGTVLTLVLSISMDVFELPTTLLDWGLACGLGFLTFLGQMFFTLALSYEQAGPVSVIRSGDVVFALCWQYLFLGVQPDLYSIIGTLVIFGGVLVVGVRKSLSMLPQDHPSRKTFRYLLK